MIGKILGKYRIDRFLDKGGMGEVYEATDANLGRKVAIKVMRAGLEGQQRFRERFHAEARLAAQLEHDNIIRVFDFGQEGNILYLVMELVPGGKTLRDYLNQSMRQGKRIALSEGLDIIRQITDALYYAHQQNMVHRDIKPENILLKDLPTPPYSQFRPVLTDFGLANIIQGETRTESKQPAGTFVYMCPEQFQNRPTDARADIYSLGIVLYEVMTGKLPFDPEPRTLFEAFDAHVQKAPINPGDIQPGLPTTVDHLILKCLKKDPKQRFQSANELSKAIQLILSRLPPPDNQPPGQLPPDVHVPPPAPPPPVVIPPLAPAQAVLLPQDMVKPPPVPPKRDSGVAPPPPPPRQPERMLVAVPGQRISDRPSAPLRDCLIIHVENKPSRRYPIEKDLVRIGRDLENDVILEDGRTSRFHAQLTRDANQTYYLTDLGSTHATWLNEQQLQPHQAQVWQPGQKARIGHTIIELDTLYQPVVRNSQPTDQNVLLPDMFSPTMGASVQISGRVSLQLSPQSVRADAGGRATMNVDITNESTNVEHVYVQIIDLPAAWYSITDPQLRLMPSEKVSLTVSFNVPRKSTSLAGQYKFVVRASIENTREALRATGIVEVAPFYQFESQMRPSRLRWTDSTSVRITNTGNVVDLYSIDCQDREQMLRFLPSQNEFQVLPGKTREVVMKVRPVIKQMMGQQQSYPFEVKVRSAQEAVPPQVHGGEHVVGPLLPRWAIGILVVFLLSCVGAIILAATQISASAAKQAAEQSANQTVQAANQFGTATAVRLDQERAETQSAGQFATQAVQATSAWANRDDDGDGLSNQREAELNTNPLNLDTDGDGLSDGQEVTIYKTDPTVRDTDGDLLTDFDEIGRGTLPTNPDTDGDGLVDSIDPDPKSPPTQPPPPTAPPTAEPTASS